jgi:cell fate regulator YaaT (PSP1 superfamily)
MTEPPAQRNIAGVRLHPTGRSFECDAGSLTLRPGDRVMVEDRRGLMSAVVTVASAERPVRGPLLRVVRRADERDLARAETHQQREAAALTFARQRARARSLPIKVFRAELLPGERSLFYFSCDHRVDFRELVRDLAAELHNRIEMRQVGVRDEAKMVGGIGSCGRELCCTTFLPQFAPVSIKMAKNQNLALNPTRVSGQCGRLKCCLVYEEATYLEASRQLPRLGKRVATPEGAGRVEDLNILAGKVRVAFPDRPAVVFDAADLQPIGADTSAPADHAPADHTPEDDGPAGIS